MVHSLNMKYCAAGDCLCSCVTFDSSQLIGIQRILRLVFAHRTTSRLAYATGTTLFHEVISESTYYFCMGLVTASRPSCHVRRERSRDVRKSYERKEARYGGAGWRGSERKERGRGYYLERERRRSNRRRWRSREVFATGGLTRKKEAHEREREGSWC